MSNLTPTYWPTWHTSVAWLQRELFPPLLSTLTWSRPRPTSPCVAPGEHLVKILITVGKKNQESVWKEGKLRRPHMRKQAVYRTWNVKLAFLQLAEPVWSSTGKGCDLWIRKERRCSITCRTGWTLPFSPHFRVDLTTMPSAGWLLHSDRSTVLWNVH